MPLHTNSISCLWDNRPGVDKSAIVLRCFKLHGGGEAHPRIIRFVRINTHVVPIRWMWPMRSAHRKRNLEATSIARRASAGPHSDQEGQATLACPCYRVRKFSSGMDGVPYFNHAVCK